MGKRIKDSDVAAVREGTDLCALVEGYTTLKRVGANFKGLCPFHDEKSASFHVTPGRGWKCFGCDESGDAIDFLRKIDHLTFVEAVEQLAENLGYTLAYEENGPGERSEPSGPPRARLVAANDAAVLFYQGHLVTPEALPARKYLAERSFTREDAVRFQLGFSPDSWDALVGHLRGHGFTDEEIIASGLASASKRGPVDRFRGRLMFPITDLNGQVVGFGARKLLDTDDGPKYLNTPETTLFKKSKLLFGLYEARKAIATQRRVVIVEGYTDVMACHLSGEATAVAACGTAFGVDHTRLVRRILGDGPRLQGEVVFTFDGDAAGQKAAVRAFEFDSAFQAATYVAVEPRGMDPCELRLADGPEGIPALIASKTPLVEFLLRTVVAKHDTRTPEGRSLAVQETADILARVGDRVLRDEYARQVAGWLGLVHRDNDVFEAVQNAARNAAAAPTRTPVARPDGAEPDGDHANSPRLSDPDYAAERRVLACVLQHPSVAEVAIVQLRGVDFLHPVLRALWELVCPAVQGDPHQTTSQLLTLVESRDRALAAAARTVTLDQVGTDGADPARTTASVVWHLVRQVSNARVREMKARMKAMEAEPDADFDAIIEVARQYEICLARRTEAEVALEKLTSAG